MLGPVAPTCRDRYSSLFEGDQRHDDFTPVRSKHSRRCARDARRVRSEGARTTGTGEGRSGGRSEEGGRRPGCGARGATEPGAQRVLRRDTHSHQLVGRRLGDGQPHHRPGRRIQVRPGRDDQAPDGLRHQDRYAARLHGRDRSLGVCRRHQGGQHPGVLREQAARGAAHDHEGSEQPGRAAAGLLVSAQAGLKRAGEGVHESEGHFHRVEGKRQDRRREQSSRQVHRVLLVRVDVDAGQPQPAPQRLLPGLRQGTGLSIQRARLQAPHGAVELDGCAAQERQRAARDLAQRQRQRRLDVPGRHRQHHRAADRRRLGGRARPQRAPGRDQAGQGTIGNASPAVAQRRVRQLRDVSGHPRPSGRRRPHRPHHGQLRRARR